LVFGFICVLALGVMGCGETSGTGGTGGGVGGGGGSASTSELEGTWQFESMEVREMTTDCPGEIVIIPAVWVCSEGTFTFNANDTFVAVGEAYGNDPPYRGEGTWSTVGDTLTVTILRWGTSTEDLEPTDPPDLWVVRWSVSGTTLTLIDEEDAAAPVTYTLRKR
jgi:hypothetical protein